MGPTCCRIISVPSHQDQSHAREDRSRAWVGRMGFDGGAQPGTLLAQNPNPGPELRLGVIRHLKEATTRYGVRQGLRFGRVNWHRIE